METQQVQECVVKTETSPDRSSSVTVQNVQETGVPAEVVASSTSSSPSSQVENATTASLPTAVISSIPRHRMITTQGHIRWVFDCIQQ